MRCAERRRSLSQVRPLLEQVAPFVYPVADTLDQTDGIIEDLEHGAHGRPERPRVARPPCQRYPRA